MSTYFSSVKWPSLLTRSSSSAIPTDAPLHALPDTELIPLNSLRQSFHKYIQTHKTSLPDCDLWRSFDELEDERDLTLLRLLRYNSLNVEKAEKQLESIFQWRASNRIAEVSEEAIHGPKVGIPVVKVGNVTENGSALIFSSAEGYCKKAVDHALQEVGVAKMFDQILYGQGEKRVKYCTVLIDFTNFSMKNIDLYGMKSGITTYLSYYPDIFDKIILIHYPKFIYGFWKAIAPLLDARTRNRVIWLSNVEEVKEELLTVFQISEIPEWLGGLADYGDKVTLMNGEEYDIATLKDRF